jgi:hypothetical protein
MDYRTDWQRADDIAAVAALDAIDTAVHDGETAHPLADDILLGLVHSDVADAYARLRKRAGFWAYT